MYSFCVDYRIIVGGCWLVWRETYFTNAISIAFRETLKIEHFHSRRMILVDLLLLPRLILLQHSNETESNGRFQLFILSLEKVGVCSFAHPCTYSIRTRRFIGGVKYFSKSSTHNSFFEKVSGFFFLSLVYVLLFNICLAKTEKFESYSIRQRNANIPYTFFDCTFSFRWSCNSKKI